MKKFNVEANELLQRNELKSVFGGNVNEDGCAIAVRNSDGSFRHWSAQIYSYEEAEGAYSNGTVYSDGSYASGYCCESC